MATSGSKSVAVTSWNTLKFSWSQVSQSVANNKTTIGWTLQLVAGSSGRISSTASKDWSVTVNGTKYSGTNTIGVGNNATKTLASGQTTITHNADGTKSFSYSFSQEFGITFSGSSIGTKSGSGTGTLNTIPRATQPTVSASSVDMGGKVTISMPRASGSFTHDLAYAFAGSAWTNITTGAGTSYSWTVPDLASKIPNATSGTVTVRCITKNGGTSVGTKTVLLTAKVPSSVVPTISTVATVEATSGLAAQFGAFIQGKSKIKATITAAGAKGSTIKTYSTTFGGKTYTGSSWTSNVVSSTGTLSLVTTVTDSRGRTAKKTTTVNVLAYKKPVVSSFTAYRVNDAGAMSSEGTKASISFAYSVASLGGKNTATMTIQYKKSTETTWTDIGKTGTSLSTSETFLASPTFSTDYQYDLRISVKDWFNASSTYTAMLPSGAVILDIKADGKGLGFFKTSERAGLEFAAPTKFSNGEVPQDAIVLAGSANLNDIKSPGFYVFSNPNSQTIKNMPIGGSGSGSVQVIREGESTQVRQVVTRCSASYREVWERLYYTNAWQKWLCVYKGGGNILWSGGLYMTEGHTVTLSEKVSEQVRGINLVFSRYVDGAVANYHFNSFFIAREFVAAHPGVGSQFTLFGGNFGFIGTKYLYINDTTITGHANNDLAGTANGITYNNKAFVLRYVIGV